MHRAIHVEVGRHGKQTGIEVHGWPGDGESSWTAYTTECTPDGMHEDANWAPQDRVARADRLRAVVGRASGLTKGRVVTAFGWHRFRQNVAVAEILLHVESRRPLLITRVNASTELIETERYAARSFLIACCVDIAQALEERAGIDHGWVDWQVPETLSTAVLQTAPGFKPIRRGRPGLRRRGHVTLRREP